MYYLKSRYYDPTIGRFISQDDVDYADYEVIGGLNLYAYCNNNPVMYSDPSGHFWDYVFDIVFIALGIYDFIQEPSLSKAGWLALDIILAILPFIPAVSSARHLGKVDNIFDFSKLFRKVDNISDVGAAVATGYNIQTWIGLASLGSICLLASNNRPRNNRAQNKQFEQAARSAGYDPKDPKIRDELTAVHQYIRKNKLNIGWKELIRLIMEWLG